MGRAPLPHKTNHPENEFICQKLKLKEHFYSENQDQSNKSQPLYKGRCNIKLSKNPFY